MTAIKALLFDLDGTLIHSMPLHDRAWLRWHERRGLTVDGPRFFAATAGRANEEILGEMFPTLAADQLQALADEKESLYRELAATALTLVAGAQHFVHSAEQAGFKLAVCTASTPENMALAFKKFGVDGWVQTVVSPADGLRGKPHPDIFLEAARRLGVAAEQCLVFEDAPLGIEAARRGGMRAVALTTTLPATAFAGYDNVVAQASDFSNLGLSALTKVNHHA